MMDAKLFLSKHFKALIYALFGLCTLALFLGLIIWSAMGVSATAEIVHEAEVLFAEDAAVQREYLVGQEINRDGLSLQVGKKAVEGSECNITVDSSSAGKKRATVSYYVSEYERYEGTFDVTYYYVRNVEIVTRPQSFLRGEDGTVTADETFELHAELNALPEDTARFSPVDGEENTIVADPALYSITASAPTDAPEGYYTADLTCGNFVLGFNYYDVAERSLLVDSADSIVSFENRSGTESALLLVVTDAPDSYQKNCTGTTKGSYIYTSADGEQTVSDFTYTLANREQFASAGVTEKYDGDAFTVRRGTETFAADVTKFQFAVVHGIVCQDGDYSLVVDSPDRILRFQNNTRGSIATLTLYVIKHEVFAGRNGDAIAEGYYIYTNASGRKYRSRFYIQMWTWDWVPLSVSHRGTDYNIEVNDYVIDKYSGDMHADVDRVSFTVTHEQIMYAAFGL